MATNLQSMSSEAIPSSADAAEDAEEEAAKGGGRGWLESAWRLGKNVAIAGAAVASAPIVIPSYCAASTIGLALAFPFGLYLATVVAAEKVMTSLFPPFPGDADEKLFEDEIDWKSVDADEAGEGGVGPPVVEQVSKKDRSLGGEMVLPLLKPDDASATAAAEEEEQAAEVSQGFQFAKAGIVSKTPLYEKMDKKESIWDEISALRTILGYRASLQPCTVDELRALYLFAGVEPPISLKDSSNVMEIKDKLQLLKLLVGVN